MHKNLLHLLKLGIWKQWPSNLKYFELWSSLYARIEY